MSDENNPHRGIGLGMTIGMWVLVLGLLTLFFQDWQEKQHNPNQSAVMRLGESGIPELILQRNRWGHYVATGAINGSSVTFMLDTGASDVAVPARVAERLGLSRGSPRIYQTANGAIKVYATVLDEVRLGDIVLHQVRASINPYMQEDEILLGMSFLKQVEFTQRGDTLTLRQLP